MPTFPHMGRTQFPGVPGQVKPVNTFDYARCDGRATIKVCRVPWDADGSNVPGFESDDARDAYLDALSGESVKIDARSAFRTLPDGTLKIPIPFSNAACYNYVVLDFEQAPGSGEPLDYAQGDSITRWLYFIDDISSDALSTTTLALTVDWWCMYANLVKVRYLMLERGHAPMAAAADVATYLGNPMGNSRYLTAPDVDYGSATVAKSAHTCSMNSNVYFCLCSYVNFQGSAGTRENSGWNCPQGEMQNVGNSPGGYVYAVEPGSALQLLASLESSQPQLLASVRSAFFIGRAFVDVRSTFELAGVQVHILTASVKTIALVSLSKSDFDVPEECANITKLYTSPYSVIEVIDSTGSVSTVRVQDCTGTVNVKAKASLALPFIGVDAVLTGIGGVNASVSFDQIANADYLLGGSGNVMRRLGIPTFAVKIDSADEYSYSTYYNRVQAQLAADNANESALASNATAYQNAVDSANTGEANVNRSNAAAQAITNESNSAASDIRTYAADMGNNTTDRANEAIDTYVSVDNGVNAGSTAISQDVAAVGGVLNAGSALVSGIAGGNPLDGAGAAIDTGVGTFISITRDGALSTLTQQANSLKGAEKKLVNSYNNAQAQTAALATTNRQNQARTNNTDTQVTASNQNAAATADTSIGNATRSKGTADANAGRALNTAENAILNGVNQAALMPPGEVCAASGENGSTRPTYVGIRVVTENDADLYAAGAQMARYGYSYGGYWPVDTYNVMPHFSYWRASEVMISAEGRTVMHGAEDAIKSMLVNGVTVWKNPDEIGTIGVFENVQA